MRNNRLQLFSVLFPFLLLLLWTAQVSWRHAHAKTYRIKVKGYDPIGFFSGHYLRFRYDLGPVPLCPEASYGREVCVCLAEAPDHTFEAQAPQDCSNVSSRCSTFMRGSCQGPFLTTLADRYYFDEKYAESLGGIPDGTAAEIILNEQGEPQVKALLVGPQRIEDYAAQLKQGIMRSTPN